MRKGGVVLTGAGMARVVAIIKRADDGLKTLMVALPVSLVIRRAASWIAPSVPAALSSRPRDLVEPGGVGENVLEPGAHRPDERGLGQRGAGGLLTPPSLTRPWPWVRGLGPGPWLWQHLGFGPPFGSSHEQHPAIAAEGCAAALHGE